MAALGADDIQGLLGAHSEEEVDTGEEDNAAVEEEEAAAGEAALPTEVYDDHAAFERVQPGAKEEEEEDKRPWIQKAGGACLACLRACCHDCKPLDQVLFGFHMMLVLVGLAVATVTSMSKMLTHNQCYLKASYNPDGSMTYTREMYWCDALLYDALVTMSLAFLFIMVNWTAQLNKNRWWMWIKLGLHVAGWLLQVSSGIMLLIAFFSWCTSIESAMAQNGLPIKEDNKCLAAAQYFDVEKNKETTLKNLYSLTLLSLGVALLAGVIWTVTLIVCLAHFCQFLYQKKEEPETHQEDDFPLDDEEAEILGHYEYPPYDENLVRQRRTPGGYDLRINNDEPEPLDGEARGVGA